MDIDMNKCVISSINECMRGTYERITQGTQISSVTETCIQCNLGFYLDENGQNCIAIQNQTLKKNYFVTANAFINQNDATDFINRFLGADILNGGFGESLNLPSPILTYLFAFMSYISTRYNRIEATIYLGRGNHYMFTCSHMDQDTFH